MDAFVFLDLRMRPELKGPAARWFSSKWRVPESAYLECMEAYLSGKTEYGWYLCLAGEQIAGGLGVIDNDFHQRKDLTPMAVEDLRAKGISPAYLVTDHTGFYERYGWEYLCPVQCDGEETPSRMYIHR